MKKINLLFLATLLAGNMMAQTPTTVYTVGDASTLGSSWADKGQPNNYIEVNDTIIFNAFLCYQSVSAQTWIAYSGSGSSTASYGEMTPFPANTAWGIGDAGTKVANGNTSRMYYFNITNASAVLVYGNSTSDRRTLVVEAYELNADLTTAGEAIDTKNIAKGDAIVSIALDPAKTYQVQVSGSTTDNARFYGIAFVKAPAAVDNATLAEITVNGNAIVDFHADTLNYTVELPYGTTEIPVVEATPSAENATLSITQATTVDGTATILVTAEDGTTTRTYTVSFTLPAAQSTDATLKSLSIDGSAIADFRADSLDYTHVIAYTATAIPAISAELNDASATMVINQATAVPGTATVVVTAQAGNQQTYTVAISRAKAIKHLTEVAFSNGAKGAINETELTVTVPYMAETEAPTAVFPFTVTGDATDVLQPSSALSADGKTILLIGIDQDTAIYTIVTTPLSPVEMGEDSVLNVTFTGEETYIFGAYGWAADKGWKFAKKVDEESNNMRNAKGNTRIYMALPAASQVSLTSGTGGARAVEIYVNGVKTNITETAAANAAITIALNDSTPNFIAIESNQTKGDGGFTAMQLIAPASTENPEPENPDPENPDPENPDPENPDPENPEEGITDTAISTPATKVIRNGQMLIIREGKTYTMQGVELQ